MLLDEVDPLEEGVEVVRDRLEVPLQPILRDIEDQLLALVERVDQFEVVVVGDADDARPGIDQAAARRLALDDLRVILDVRGGRYDAEEGGQVGDAADIIEAAPALQFVRQGGEVGGLALVVEIDDRGVDFPMRPTIEILRVEVGAHADNRLAVDQEGAEDGLLRLAVVRW